MQKTVIGSDHSSIFLRISALTGWRRALVAVTAGAIATLALPPFDVFPAGFIAFPLLVLLIDGDATRVQIGKLHRLHRLLPGFMTGWLFGFGYFVAGLWWIGAALLVDAQAFAWALPLAVLGLPAFLAIFYGFAVTFSRLFWDKSVARIFVLAISFGVIEWLRAFVLTGFPWNSIGYMAMPVPVLMQSVAITGLYGMNALAVLVFAMPAVLFSGLTARKERIVGLSLALILMLSHIGYGAWCLHQAPAIDQQSAVGAPVIRLVQASIEQDNKWDNQLRRAIFDRHLALTTQAPLPGQPQPDVIIWPETALPYIFSQVPEAKKAISAALKTDQVLLTGAVREQPAIEKASQGAAPTDSTEPRYFNSILSIDANGNLTGFADKIHLVPFGEYLPLENWLRRFGIQEVVDMPGGFTAATSRKPLVAGKYMSLLPLICYEVIFPSELGYDGGNVSAIINVTNDAWYGNTPGPYQHVRQAQLRAVEQGMPLLRAANNGISAIIDPYGRIIAGLQLNQVGVIDAQLPEKAVLFWGNAPGVKQLLSILLILLTVSLAFRRFSVKRAG